jgi:hypothetical protein
VQSFFIGVGFKPAPTRKEMLLLKGDYCIFEIITVKMPRIRYHVKISKNNVFKNNLLKSYGNS